jgi:hypothetical protein
MKNIFECEICGARFYDEKNCVAHENEHKTEKARKAEREVKKKESINNIEKLRKNYLEAFEKHQKEFGSSPLDADWFNDVDWSDLWRKVFC